MKLSFKPSPNYRSPQSTDSIMRDLTICLCAVTVFAVVYYGLAWGMETGLRVVLLMVTSIVAALCTEAVWFMATKQNVKEGILSSYGWVTAIILTLISSVNVSYYGLAISTIIAILFGKLVFGGFGQNIFNPAAFGEAILMSSFAASNRTDLMTTATPTMVMKGSNWIATSESLAKTVESFGGFGKMLLGGYTSTIGSTCAILLVLCLIFLIWQKDIDWQMPVFYIGTVFVLTAIIGLAKGAGLGYGLFHVLAGGVLFGGVFMCTDPVTTPVTIPGRIVYAVGAAVLTVIFRWRSNFADGVLYSILLMNMLTPAIDKLFDGNQIKDAGKIRTRVLASTLSCLCIGLLIGMFGLKTTAEESTSGAAAPSAEGGAAAATNFGAPISLGNDFKENRCEVEEISNDGTQAVYHVTARGFGLIDPDGIASSSGHEYKRNEAEITVDLASKTITNYTLTVFGDTEGIGDLATTEEAQQLFVGKGLSDEVDSVTGATYTSESLVAMAAAALNAASGN